MDTKLELMNKRLKKLRFKKNSVRRKNHAYFLIHGKYSRIHNKTYNMYALQIEEIEKAIGVCTGTLTEKEYLKV